MACASVSLRLIITVSRTSLHTARNTDDARPSLVAVSGTHRFQVGCAHLPMPAWSGVTVSLRLHPARRRYQPPPSPVVVILAADVHGCPLLAIVHFRWLEAASGTVCRPTSPQLQNCLKTYLDHFLPNCFRFLVPYTVYSSGLTVLFLSYSK